MKNNSIITSKYEGWITSILLHGLLSLIFLFVIYDNPIDISEYTDVTFSNYNPIDLPVIEDAYEEVTLTLAVYMETELF